MTLWEFAGAVFGLLFLLPVVVYLCVKLATWAYLNAREKFDREHPHNHRQEKSNGDEG